MTTKEELIKHWEITGTITDKAVIKAFNAVKREDFVLPENKEEVYEDRPLPIGYDATISQPTTVLLMLQWLEIKPGNKILEIGTGSGWNAALISKIVRSKSFVYTTEVVPELVEFAKNNLKKAKIKNVKVILADGSAGLPDDSQFDRIIVTASCPSIPKPLIEQLKDPGILIAPVGPQYTQEMIKLKKENGKTYIENLGSFVFVPLIGKYGWKKPTTPS